MRFSLIADGENFKQLSLPLRHCVDYCPYALPVKRFGMIRVIGINWRRIFKTIFVQRSHMVCVLNVRRDSMGSHIGTFR